MNYTFAAGGNRSPGEEVMRKVCPQCQASYADQFFCPNCGVEMLDIPDRSAVITGPTSKSMRHENRSTAQRLLAGVIVGQALYYGLRQLGTAFLLAAGLGQWWSTSPGRIAAPLLQLVAVLLGGLVAGAGNARSTACGAAVGLINALLFLGAQYFLNSRPPEPQLLAGWIVCIALASAGAALGRWFWPALEDWPNAMPVKKEKTKDKKRRGKDERRNLPISWFRILGGAVLAVGCTVWAGPIREFLIHSGRGMFAMDSHMQSQFVAWVISALAMLAGGAFAGALSHGGVRHGFLVGVLASAGIFVIHLQVIHEVFPAEHFFAALVQMPESDTPTVGRTLLFLITNTMLLGTLGGIFGRALLPMAPTGPRGGLDRGAI
jgi:hypothetical protein